MVETLKDLYETYAVEGKAPPKQSFADAFKGWFSGKGRETPETDASFMEEVDKCVTEIRESNDPAKAFEAVQIILSQPRAKKFTRQGLFFAAMHSKALVLVPLLKSEDRVRALELMQKVPKAYRFPVYKELKEALEKAE